LNLSPGGVAMPVFHLDIETRSALDLTDVGLARYAVDRSTDVWLLAFAIGDEPPRLWFRGDPVPAEFAELARDPSSWHIAAHNSAFEAAIWEHVLAPRYGFPPVPPIEQFRCTMAMSLACALPGKLDRVANALELQHRKDKAGHALMKQMARPRKARKGEDPNAGPYWFDEPAKIARLGAYCIGDVECERELFHRLPALSDAEQRLWQLDARINRRGFYTDGPLLEASARLAATIKLENEAELARITDGAVTSTSQLNKLAAWLGERGCTIKDKQKSTLAAALRRKGLDAAARRAIEIRLASAHDVKCDTMLAYRGADGRIRGTLRYHGAATGRWSAFGVQVQNYVRDSGGIDAKIAAIMAGDLSAYPQPLAAIADASRGAIAAAPSHRFLVGDFSGVESRVLAWIAGEVTKLDQWRAFDATGDPLLDPYFLAGKACGLPDELARPIGKVVDLAFGYQGGVAAYSATTYEGDPSTETDRERFKRIFRDHHPRTVAFWYGVDRAAIKAVRTPGSVHAVQGVSFCCDADFLKLTLPSGRVVRYPQPRLDTNRFDEPAVFFKDTAGGKWADCNYGTGAYGGLWSENIVQAVARDLLAEAMQRLEAAGYPIVLTVHDEIIAEVPNGFGSLDEFKRLLIAAPAWASDLPIAAKCREGERYSKPGPGAAVEAVAAAAEGLEEDQLEEDQLEEANEPNIAEADASPSDPPVGPSAASPVAESLPTPPAPPLPLTFAEAQAILDRPRQPALPPGANGHDPHASSGVAGPAPKTDPELGPYVYQDACGAPHQRVTRMSHGPSRFTQQHWDGKAWVPGMPTHKLPYRLPELLAADPAEWVCITEGEKDVVNVANLGLTATTNPNGANGWRSAKLVPYFAHVRRIAILEDNDQPGRERTKRIVETLRLVDPAPDIRVVAFPELPEHGDVSDWLAEDKSRGRAELLARIEAAKPDRPKLKIAPIRDWDGQPAPEIGYGVQDRFPLEVVNLLSGEGGGGKSTTTQQLAVAHALGGREWLGCVPRKGPAIYVECEDPEKALQWRQKAIAEHYGVTQAMIADAGFQMLPLADGEESAILATAPDKSGIIHPTPLYDQLYEMAGDIKPVMIGIASAAIVFAGNENVRPEVQQFMWLLRRLARVSGGYVLLVAQPSLTGIGDASVSHAGLSGTTQWHNGSRGRAVLRAVKPEGGGADTGLREIKFYKNQYGPLSASCFVRYTNGLFLPVDGMSTDGAEQAARAEGIFIALLKKFTAQHQVVSHAIGRNYAPTRFAGQPEALGITRQEFAAAMQRLLDAKAIEIRTWGKASRPGHYLALVGGG
jgi:DNA polymerase bacteriophage-type